MSEEGGEASTRFTGPRLAHFENMLQELTRVQDRKRRLGVESASANTKQKLLNNQLLQAQEELAAAQMSKAKLCEEIGMLKQVKEHQAKQLDTYKMDLDTTRESLATKAKKMEELEISTRTAKQQYIQSLASRIKTSALVLQQLNMANGTLFSARVTGNYNEWELTKPSKRKRVMEEDAQPRDGNKPKPPEIAVDIEPQSKHSGSVGVADPVTEPQTKNSNDIFSSSSRKTEESKQQDDYRAENKRLIIELQAQVAELESEHSALNDKYTVLESEHNETLADCKASAQVIEEKNLKIEELMEMLEVSRSKEQSAIIDKNDEDKETLEGRLKMLEENLAQMNGYADQLEMVIAQCPSCTVKLQNEGTQDSNRAE